MTASHGSNTNNYHLYALHRYPRHSYTTPFYTFYRTTFRLSKAWLGSGNYSFVVEVVELITKGG